MVAVGIVVFIMVMCLCVMVYGAASLNPDNKNRKQ